MCQNHVHMHDLSKDLCAHHHHHHNDMAQAICNHGPAREVTELEIGRQSDGIAAGLEKIDELSRRRFLTGGARSVAGLSVAGYMWANLIHAPLHAYGDEAVKTGQFVFPRLRFDVNDETPDRWNVSPIGDVNLRRKLEELTNINISQEGRVVTLADFDDMCRNPFVFMTSEGYFTLTDQEKTNMREFLERGGFILADDCVYNTTEDRFFRTYNKVMNELFPDNPMRKIPYDHEIFHIYYDFPDGCPHMQGVPHGAYGMFEPQTGRIMTINCPGDIHCGWVNRWFNPQKNLDAMKMGINIIIYFLSH